MRIQIITPILIFISFSSAFQTNALEPSDEVTDTPEQVVERLITAMAENDGSKIKSVFAKDATQLYERWYARKKKGSSFWKWLESDIINTQGKVVEPKYKTDADSVIVTGYFENNEGYRSPADFLFTVRNGKITSWTIRYD